MPAPASVRTRLSRALTGALKARDAAAVSALRSALAAIGNAEAVDPGEPGRTAAPGSVHVAGAAAGLGAAEAQRRQLSEDEVAAIVSAEAAERDAAARQYECSGHGERAADLRHGTRALLEALGHEDV